jgi:hypothetical protein
VGPGDHGQGLDEHEQQEYVDQPDHAEVDERIRILGRRLGPVQGYDSGDEEDQEQRADEVGKVGGGPSILHRSNLPRMDETNGAPS